MFRADITSVCLPSCDIDDEEPVGKELGEGKELAERQEEQDNVLKLGDP